MLVQTNILSLLIFTVVSVMVYLSTLPTYWQAIKSTLPCVSLSATLIIISSFVFRRIILWRYCLRLPKSRKCCVTVWPNCSCELDTNSFDKPVSFCLTSATNSRLYLYFNCLTVRVLVAFKKNNNNLTNRLNCVV